MINFTVKNIPNDLYDKLKRAAEINRRSINSEIIVCISEKVSSQAIEPAAMIKRAQKLRRYTATYPVTDGDLSLAKINGRP